MDKWKNDAQSPDQVIADANAKVGSGNASFGGTKNVLGSYSVADEKKDVLAQGSAHDSFLDSAPFDNSTPKSLRM